MQLKLDRLTKQYGSKIAVDRVSATLTRGVYGLLGANGAGKTTLMRMLCGILTPTSGEVLLNGESIYAMDARYRDLLGYLPQDFGYYPEYSAQDFLLYIAALKGLPRPQAKQKTAQLLEEVALAGVAKKRIKTFSGGMKQRLGIAQALLNEPEILVLDEPTAGLDPKERVRLRNLLADLAKDRIVLLSTHIVSDVESIADRVFLMKQGAFVLEGTVAQLVEKMQGRVWEYAVPDHLVHRAEQEYAVANLRHEGGQTVLRIVADAPPGPEARACTPGLEDLYLYHFSGETEAQ